ncbi:MAG: hypothetical protein R6X23_03855 [Acidimicrobiia bacterium]
MTLAAIASGCGGGGVSDEDRRLYASQLAQGVRKELLQRRTAAANRAWSLCSKQLARLSSAVEDVDEMLDEPTYYDDYSPGVARIARELDRLDLPELSEKCLGVAAQLEGAGVLYDSTEGLWGLCDGADYAVPSCADAKLDPLLKKGWRQASRKREKADELLDRMRTPGPANVTTSVPESAGDVQMSVYGQAVVVYTPPDDGAATSSAFTSAIGSSFPT